MYSQTVLVCLVLSVILFQVTEGASAQPDPQASGNATLAPNTTVPSTSAPGGVSKTPAPTTKSPATQAPGIQTQAPQAPAQSPVTKAPVGGTNATGAPAGPTSNTTKTPGNYGDTIHLPSYVTMTLTVCTSLYGLARQMY